MKTKKQIREELAKLLGHSVFAEPGKGVKGNPYTAHEQGIIEALRHHKMEWITALEWVLDEDEEGK